MNVIERTRISGKCPPSLFRDESHEDTFEAAVAKIIDPDGTSVVGSRAGLHDMFTGWLPTTESHFAY